MSALTPDHEALLKAFLAEETARGRRKRGIEELARLARAFLHFVEERGKLVTELKRSDAAAYQGSFVEKSERHEIAAGTIVPYVAAASGFCAYLTRTGTILGNPFEGMRRVRVEKRVRSDILKERETAALLKELRAWEGAETLLRMKNRYLAHVVAELQYASGLRIAEVAALKPEDIDVERALVYVHGGKHGSNRIGFLTDYAACVLERYLGTMRPFFANIQNDRSAGTVFLRGFPHLRNTVNAELAAACARLGLPRITSHGFRHALGYHLLRSGCALRYIQAILGHRKIKDTEVYTKVDVEDVKTVFDACHPRTQ